MSELVIVTAASSNHFECLRNLLYSISLYEPRTRTIVYDLDLKPAEVRKLEADHWEVEKFPFEKYPPHFDLKIERGQYAWKPAIIAEVASKTDQWILWLDAGNLLQRRLDRIRKILVKDGFYSPKSNGTIGQWTHPGTLAYLNASSELLTKTNRNGAIIGFAPERPGITELITRWKEGAMDSHCIAPPGSDRSNHRQDQSVLSVLAYQFQERYRFNIEDRFLDLTTHNDDLSRTIVRILLFLPVKARKRFLSFYRLRLKPLLS
jgi:Protein of unknown function (DUF1647)